jgi:GTP-binding protein
MSQPVPVAEATYTTEQLQRGHWLFAQPCDFMLSVAGLPQLPATELPEVAFVGRSNVGKSTLINALTSRNGLAKTSNTPGRTQQLNFFNLGGHIILVDLPGYGYAKVPKEMVDKWVRLLKKYLAGRPQLRRVYVLVDARHGLKESDVDMMNLLDKTAVTYQVVLTKTDKIKQSEQQKRQREITDALAKRPAAYPLIMLTSSVEKAGVDVLRAEIATFCQE